MHTLSSAAPPLILAAAGLTLDDAISAAEPSTRAVIKPMDVRVASPLDPWVSMIFQLNRETDFAGRPAGSPLMAAPTAMPHRCESTAASVHHNNQQHGKLCGGDVGRIGTSHNRERHHSEGTPTKSSYFTLD